MSKTKYETIGTIWKREPIDRNGNSTLDYDGRATYTFTADKDSEIIVNGKKVSEFFVNVERPDVKFHRMFEMGILTKEQFEDKIALFEEGGQASNLTFELSLGKAKKK